MWKAAPDTVKEFFEHAADLQSRANAYGSQPEKVKHAFCCVGKRSLFRSPCGVSSCIFSSTIWHLD